MALTITWPTPANGFVGRIFVPKADTTLVSAGPPEIRSLNVNSLRLSVGTLYASAAGAYASFPFIHTGEITVSGFTYARLVVFLYEVEFEDGSYVVQLSGANHNVLDVIVPNSVSVQVQNSAGLVNVLQLYDIAYLGQIHYDATNGLPSGSNDPQQGHGTPQNPVSTLADILALSSKINLRSVHNLNGTLTLDTQDFDDWNFEITSGAAVNLNGRGCDGATFRGGMVYGAATGLVTFDLCSLTNVSGVRFNASQCRLNGTMTPATGDSAFTFCTSGVPGTAAPAISLAAGDVQVSVRSYSGGVEIQNSSNPLNVMTLEFIAGQFKAFATVTDGTFVVRGDCYPVDLTGSTATFSIDSTSRVMWKQQVIADTTPSGSFGELVGADQVLTGQLITELWQAFGLDSSNPVRHKDTASGTPGYIRVPADGSTIDVTVTQVAADEVELERQ